MREGGREDAVDADRRAEARGDEGQGVVGEVVGGGDVEGRRVAAQPAGEEFGDERLPREDDGTAREVARGDAPARGERIALAQVEAPAVDVGEDEVVVAGDAAGADEQREVEEPRAHGFVDLRAVAGGDFDPQARVLLAQGGRCPRDGGEGRGFARADGEGPGEAAGAFGSDFLAGAVGQRDDVVGAPQEAGAALGRFDAARVAHEEGAAELFFEFAQLHRERGLRDAEGGGGAGDVPGPHDGGEVSEGADFHGAGIVARGGGNKQTKSRGGRNWQGRWRGGRHEGRPAGRGQEGKAMGRTSTGAVSRSCSGGPVRRGGAQRGQEEVPHFVAAAVEGGVVGAGGLRGPEGEEEHPPCGAEGLLGAGGVPAGGKAFGSEDHKGAARFVDGVAAGFFAGAEEGPDARAAGARARGPEEGGPPFGAVFRPGAGAAEGLEDRQLQEGGVAVGVPVASGEGEGSGAAEVAPVFEAPPGALGVLADVQREGGELAAAENDPVVPGGVEDRRHGGRLAGRGQGG